MTDHPERWNSPFTQVELRRLWTYSDGALTVKGYRLPGGTARAGSWVLVDQATGNVQGVVPPGEFSRRFRPVDLFADVPALATYLGTVTAADGTALVDLALDRNPFMLANGPRRVARPHALIVPRSHRDGWSSATAAELEACRTAMTLVAAILLGLRQRDRTGKGSWVGTSLYANGVWANGTSAAGALIGAKLPTRQPPDRPRNALTNLYRTRDDRWLQLLLVRDDRLWPVLCKAIERPDLAEDPRFVQRADRRARSLELVKELMPVFAARTYAEWEKAFAGTGIPFGVIGRLADVVQDEQADHAGIFAETDNAEVPRTVNNPIRLGFAKPRKSGPPPAVGQHSEEILREAGLAADEIDALRKSGALG
jgi:hypothetical protein